MYYQNLQSLGWACLHFIYGLSQLYDQVHIMEHEKVVIVGGGLIGCSTAYMLKKMSPNCQVLLLESSSGTGQACSYQNGGTLSYSFTTCMNPIKAIRESLFNSFPSFYSIHSSALFNPSFWFWAFRSMVSSYTSVDRNSLIFDLGKRSSELQVTLRKELLSNSLVNNEEYLGDDEGLAVFYSTIDKFEACKKRSLELNQKKSTKIHIIATRKASAKHEPLVEEWPVEIVGMAKNFNDYLSAHDSYRLTSCITKMIKQMGVVVQNDSHVESFFVKEGKVTSLTLTNGQELVADKFIICAGVGSRDIGSKLGWKAPIWPVSGITFNLKTSKKFRHTIYLNDSHPTYLTPLRDSTYRVSSFYEFTTPEVSEVDANKIEFLKKRVAQSFNIKDAEFSDYWSCKRPVTVDDLPIIGEFPNLSNVFINSGHGSRGSILCLSSAELISHIILGKKPLMDPRPFSPNRFWL